MRWPRGRVAAGAAVAGGVLAAAALVVLQPEEAWQVQVEGRLLPREPSAYVQEVLSRTAVVRTFGELVADPGVTAAAAAAAGVPSDRLDGVAISVRADRTSSVLVVVLTARDRELVARLGSGLLPAAAAYLDRVAPLYRLEPQAAGAPRVVTRTRVAVPGL